MIKWETWNYFLKPETDTFENKYQNKYPELRRLLAYRYWKQYLSSLGSFLQFIVYIEMKMLIDDLKCSSLLFDFSRLFVAADLCFTSSNFSQLWHLQIYHVLLCTHVSWNHTCGDQKAILNWPFQDDFNMQTNWYWSLTLFPTVHLISFGKNLLTPIGGPRSLFLRIKPGW